MTGAGFLAPRTDTELSAGFDSLGRLAGMVAAVYARSAYGLCLARIASAGMHRRTAWSSNLHRSTIQTAMSQWRCE